MGVKGAKKFSPQDRDDAIALYLSGKTMDEVAKAIGMKRSCTLSSWMKARNIKARPFAPPNKVEKDVVTQAISLYVNDKQTIPETAAIIGVGTSTIARWLRAAGVTRSMGDAFAIASQKGRKRWGRGATFPWQSTKTGAWEFADSRWEVVRMQQLDADDSITKWSRIVDRVPYVDRNGKKRVYAPDFVIHHSNGRAVVEEIKPLAMMMDANNLIKADAAAVYFKARGIEYRILTEFEIGVDAIKAFKLVGLSSITEDLRTDCRKKRRNKRNKLLRRPRVEASNALKEQNAAKSVAMYSSGMTLAEVAGQLQICVKSVKNHLTARGVKTRPAVMRPKARIAQGARMRARTTSARMNVLTR